MGDLGEYWRDVKEARRANGAISNQYMNEADRERGTAYKQQANDRADRATLKRLERAGLKPVYKSTASFQIDLNGRKGMFYSGKRGEHIRFNDGEVVRFDAWHTLHEWLKTTAQPKKEANQ